MSWFELLLFLHILAMGLWLGSGLAILVLAARARNTPEAFGPFMVNATWWAGRAHPAAGVVLLLTGFGMVADADLSVGDTWVLLGLIGLIIAMGIGGGVTGRTAEEMVERIQAGTAMADLRPLIDRLLLSMRVELVIIVLVVADMVAKPGL